MARIDLLTSKDRRNLLAGLAPRPRSPASIESGSLIFCAFVVGESGLGARRFWACALDAPQNNEDDPRVSWTRVPSQGTKTPRSRRNSASFSTLPRPPSGKAA